MSYTLIVTLKRDEDKSRVDIELGGIPSLDNLENVSSAPELLRSLALQFREIHGEAIP